MKVIIRTVPQGRCEPTDARWDLCQFARIYDDHLQIPEALRLYQGCLAMPATAPVRQAILWRSATLAGQNGMIAQARALLGVLEKEFPDFARSVRSSLALPEDAP